ncbi:hypothetical protein [Desulfosporosinus orientis]|nr:hypothetical protein [Desulfosporosinus orientis]
MKIKGHCTAVTVISLSLPAKVVAVSFTLMFTFVDLPSTVKSAYGA